MAKTDKLTESFLNGLTEIEPILSLMSFKKTSFQKKGYAYFIEYQRKGTIVLFLFGPSDWAIEMIINTSKGKYAGKDLLQIPEILKWINENKYQQITQRDMRNELLWFIELLKVSLPYVE